MLRREVIRDGTAVDVRPIEPSDKGLLNETFESLSARSRYERFLTPMDRLGPAMLRYFTEVDHHDHEALIALDPDSGRLVGVARFVRDTDDPHAAEAAVTVADDWHGRGVGTMLLHCLAERARHEQVHRFTALVLARNADMIDMLRRLGKTRVVERTQGAVEIEVELPAAGVGEQLRALLRLAAHLTRARVPFHH